MSKNTKKYFLCKFLNRKEAKILYDIVSMGVINYDYKCFLCNQRHNKKGTFPNCDKCNNLIPDGIRDLEHELHLMFYPPKKTKPIDDDLPF